MKRMPHSATPSLFDDDDDDDSDKEIEHTLSTTAKHVTAASETTNVLTPKAGIWSRFDDDDDDDAVEEEGGDGAQSDDSTILSAEETSSKAVLLTLVRDLRREITELRAEMVLLKGESIEHDTPVDQQEAGPESPAITLVKGHRPRPPPPMQNSAEWERLANEEKARRQAKRGLQRRGKRPAKTSSSEKQTANKWHSDPNFTQPQCSSSIAKLTTSPPQPAPVRGKDAHQTRRDSFFDASSDSASSDDKSIGQGKGAAPAGRDSFAWDDDSNDGSSCEERSLSKHQQFTHPYHQQQEQQPQQRHQAASTELNPLSQTAPAAEKLRMEVAATTLAWARGKDIVSMLASVSLVFSGELNFRLPPAWTWRGSAVQDRTAILPGEIRKAYLRIVRYVHPDKQGNCTLLIKTQANTVFTALSDAYAVAQLSK